MQSQPTVSIARKPLPASLVAFALRDPSVSEPVVVVRPRLSKAIEQWAVAAVLERIGPAAPFAHVLRSEVPADL